jgi:choline dehydrogenase-like flavoprotein
VYTFINLLYTTNNLLVGGTAGCVVAGRLAEADPNLSILVIEGGPNNLDVPTVVHPALSLGALVPTSDVTLFYQGVKESQLNDRELVVPSGGTLGGGSSINLMMYSRAQRSDFDAWGVEGWSADDMIPYLKKVCSHWGYDGALY